jgi:hypothetical protein
LAEIVPGPAVLQICECFLLAGQHILNPITELLSG